MNATDSSPKPSPYSDGPYGLLMDGKYLRLWLIGAVANTMRWLEMLAVGVYVFDKTSSPFLVAVVLFCRLAPMVMFGAVLGAFAEKINKKYMLLGGLITITVTSTVIGVMLVTDTAQIWHIAVGAFISGFLMAMDFPVRRNMVGEVSGHDRVGQGMALDATTNNVTRMLGPIMGGLILETVGLHGAFLLGAALHAIGIILILSLKYTPAPTNKEALQKNFFAGIVDGLRFIRSDRTILAMMVITIALNFLAMPFASMVPVIGKELLNLNAIHIGILASAEGFGAFIGCVLIAFWKTQRFAQVFIFGSAIYLLFLLSFSFSSLYILSLILLFLAGLGHAGFSVGQSTIVFTKSNPEVRGRVMGLLSMFIGVQPLGILHIGFLADYFGGSLAVTIMTVEGLIALGICWLVWPEMQKYETPSAS